MLSLVHDWEGSPKLWARVMATGQRLEPAVPSCPVQENDCAVPFADRIRLVALIRDALFFADTRRIRLVELIRDALAVPRTGVCQTSWAQIVAFFAGPAFAALTERLIIASAMSTAGV